MHMDNEVHQKLESIDGKLDRLLDPEDGIYAKLAEHRSEDAVKHRTIYIVLAVAASVAAGASSVAKVLLAALN